MQLRKKHLILDLDSTIADTPGWVRNAALNSYGRDDHRTKALFRMGVRNVAVQTNEEINGYAWNLLSNGAFMVEADLAMPFASYYAKFLQLIKDIVAEGHQLDICTHRGWHVRGRQYSESWLEATGIKKYVTDLHCIRSKEHPNKLTFLHSLYGDDFLLVDDDPFNQGNVPGLKEQLTRWKDNLVVPTACHAFPYMEGVPSFNTYDGFIDLIKG